MTSVKGGTAVLIDSGATELLLGAELETTERTELEEVMVLLREEVLLRDADVLEAGVAGAGGPAGASELELGAGTLLELGAGTLLELGAGVLLELDTGVLLELDTGVLLELDTGVLLELDTGGGLISCVQLAYKMVS